MPAEERAALAREISTAASNGGLVRLVALGAAICGVIALALGGPRLMSALIALRADPVLAKVERGEPLPADELEMLVESRHAASVWHDDSRAWLAIGLARLDTARQEKADAERRRRQLDRAVYALERALGMAPRNGIAWMRLGEALLMRAGPSPRAARALKMSIDVAPVAPEFAVERLKLLFAAWELFDGDVHAGIVRQVEMTARNSRSAPALAALMGSAEGESYAALLRSVSPGASR